MCAACDEGAVSRLHHRLLNHEENRKPIVEMEVFPLGMN